MKTAGWVLSVGLLLAMSACVTPKCDNGAVQCLQKGTHGTLQRCTTNEVFEETACDVDCKIAEMIQCTLDPPDMSPTTDLLATLDMSMPLDGSSSPDSSTP